MRSLVASRRRGRLEGAEAVQAHPLQDPADGCRRDAGLLGNRLAGQALEPQLADPGDDGLRGWAMEPLRPRGPALQTDEPFDGITRHPFAEGARTDVRQRIIRLALDEPALSPRELAVRFTVAGTNVTSA